MVGFHHNAGRVGLVFYTIIMFCKRDHPQYLHCCSPLLGVALRRSASIRRALDARCALLPHTIDSLTSSWQHNAARTLTHDDRQEVQAANGGNAWLVLSWLMARSTVLLCCALYHHVGGTISSHTTTRLCVDIHTQTQASPEQQLRQPSARITVVMGAITPGPSAPRAEKGSSRLQCSTRTRTGNGYHTTHNINTTSVKCPIKGDLFGSHMRAIRTRGVSRGLIIT